MSDEDRRALERQALANPDDEQVQRALLVARERAGEPIRQGLAARLVAALAERRKGVLRDASAALTELQVLRNIYGRSPNVAPWNAMTRREQRRSRSTSPTVANHTAEADALREIGKMLGRENEIEGALYLGRTFVGCSGEHHGIGTRECPKRLHHHHDHKCVQEDRVTSDFLDRLAQEVATELLLATIVAFAREAAKLLLGARRRRRRPAVPDRNAEAASTRTRIAVTSRWRVLAR